MLDVGSKSPQSSDHLLVFKNAHLSGKFKQLQGIFQAEVFDELPFFEASEYLFLVFGVSNLHERTKLAQASGDGLARYGMGTNQSAGVDVLTRYLLRFFHTVVELAVEAVHHVLPIFSTGCDFVKLLFDLGRKVEVNHVGEMLDQEVVDHHGNIGREEFVFLCSRIFCFGAVLEGTSGNEHLHILAWGAFSCLLVDVVALLYRRNGWGISRRSADAQFLQFLYQRGFRVAWSRSAEGFSSLHFFQAQGLSYRHRRKEGGVAAFFVFRLLVGIFKIYLQETIKNDDFASCLKLQWGIGDGHGDGGPLEGGIGHLGGDGSLPNQFVQALLVAVSGYLGY